MAVKVAEEDLVQVEAWLKALEDLSPEVYDNAQSKLQSWVSESPEHHIPYLFMQADGIGSERKKQRLGPIIGEVVTLATIPVLASFGLYRVYNGNIARDAIEHWIRRATVPDVDQAICICLDVSSKHRNKVLMDFTIKLTSQCVQRTPDAAFWPVIRKLKSQSRRYPTAAQVGEYLADFLPGADLPRPSNGSSSMSADLPFPAENNTHNTRDLPIPALVSPIQFLRTWWRRKKS